MKLILQHGATMGFGHILLCCYILSLKVVKQILGKILDCETFMYSHCFTPGNKKGDCLYSNLKITLHLIYKHITKAIMIKIITFIGVIARELET